MKWAARIGFAFATMAQREWSGISGELSPGGVRHGHIWRQLQLAWAHMDARERAAHPRPDVLLSLLRGELHD
jgi:hypothetical protein